MIEAGVTTKDAHSGMGLTVCARALESMKGTLSHRPREGGGIVAEVRWRGDDDTDASPSS